ncbi:MAG: oxidoreductase [Labilithrix sp.]|nr:oxidoreductase [Labilithrix sp.]
MCERGAEWGRTTRRADRRVAVLTQGMRIDVWSDVICPWCWLGRARLDKAVAASADRDPIEIVYRSFELDPSSDRTLDIPTNEMLQKKFGMGQAQIDAMHARVAGLGQEEGIEFKFERARTSNTFEAHQLTHFAHEHGKRLAMVDRLFEANFKEGIRVGDRASLVKLAGEVGLDAAEAERALAEERFADAVRADQSAARELGIRGVPFFVFDGKAAVSGAESVATLQSAIARAKQT